MTKKKAPVKAKPLTRQDLLDRVNRSGVSRQYSMAQFQQAVSVARHRMLASPEEITRLAKGRPDGKPANHARQGRGAR